ncbi:MAG: TRAP transporter small permease [Desulfoprunum sp.]|jgi:C4-dicarboxylate transporter DctQ subunit|uniref:TRAP transporter small permease n=1 Tax=Desulfoprunum sp. TaxID=2020866 RepID=UPI003C73782A
MERIEKISKAAHTAGAILLGFLFLSIISGVIVRMLGGYLHFVDELSGYGAVWVTFLGIGYVLREGRHVRVDIITRKLSPRNEAIMFMIGDIACLLFSILIIWKGLYLVSVSYQVHRVTPLLGWPIYILQMILPLSFVLFGLESMVGVVKAWKKIRHPNVQNSFDTEK